MDKSRLHPLALVSGIAAIVVLAVPSTAFGQSHVTSSQLRACHDYVWFEAPDFQNLPNAAISITSGKIKDGQAKVWWEVKWDDVHASGVCLVNRDNQVTKFKIKHKEQNWAHGSGGDIYFDTHSRRWKTPDGQVCNTCTPENGFEAPVMDGNYYYDSEIRKWRDSNYHGAVCNTCTSDNGFPIPPDSGWSW